jgi:hypothetical protein
LPEAVAVAAYEFMASPLLTGPYRVWLVTSLSRSALGDHEDGDELGPVDFDLGDEDGLAPAGGGTAAGWVIRPFIPAGGDRRQKPAYQLKPAW